MNTEQAAPELALRRTIMHDGLAGTHYGALLTACGGKPPYRFRLVGGFLPEGLTLDPDGVLHGIPKTAGIAVFHAYVVDSVGTIHTPEWPFLLKIL